MAPAAEGYPAAFKAALQTFHIFQCEMEIILSSTKQLRQKKTNNLSSVAGQKQKSK